MSRLRPLKHHGTLLTSGRLTVSRAQRFTSNIHDSTIRAEPPAPTQPASMRPSNGTNVEACKTTGPNPVSESSSAWQASHGPLKTHQFDTFKLVSSLQRAGYSHEQAVALMQCLRSVLVNGTEFAKSHYLSRGDLENVYQVQCGVAND
jgi:Coiled-coil domain-containing protein 90-like